MKTYINITNRILLAVVFFVLASCNKVDVIEDQQVQTTLDLSASKIQVTTKAETTPVLEDFLEGTIYSIYAYEVKESKENNLWDKSNPRECKEDNNHKIDYWTNYGNKKISLGTKTANFYGLTYGSTKIEATKYDPLDPRKVKIETDNGKVKDLMFSNNLKNCNSSQGELQMNFKHAMSKIKFQIYKDEESDYEYPYKHFRKTTLTGIEIRTCKGANFNVKTGEWSDWENTNKSTLVYYSNTTGVPLKTSVQDVKGLEEALIIPNDPTAFVEVTVHLEKVREDTTPSNEEGVPKTLTYVIKKNEQDVPFTFLPNHQYTIVIGILRTGGKTVIAFKPIVEPWKDIEIDLGETK